MDKPSVDIHNLPTQFAALLAQTQPGQEIIVTEAGQPRAILRPIAPEAPAKPAPPQKFIEITATFLGQPKKILVPVSDPSVKRRVPGLGVGKIEILPGFDDPLPDEFWLGES